MSFAGIVTAILVVWYAKRAFDTSQDQIALQFPAKIKLLRIGIKPAEPIGEEINFKVIKIYNADVYSANYGRADAVVVEARIMPYWRKGFLPMYAPYFDPGNEGSIIKALPNVIGDFDSSPKPGQFLEWHFAITFPKDYEPEMQLYILGYIKYKDSRNPYRITLFGRRYDDNKHRFVPVDDTAYDEPDLN